MVRRCFIWALLGCAWTGTALGQNDELVVRQQSARFESARNRGALKESRRLLAADATCYDLPGRDSRSLHYDLALAAQRRHKSGKARLEPVRVISREVRVQGTVAIVTELLGAAEDVPRGQKVMPRISLRFLGSPPARCFSSRPAGRGFGGRGRGGGHGGGDGGDDDDLGGRADAGDGGLRELGHGPRRGARRWRGGRRR